MNSIDSKDNTIASNNGLNTTAKDDPEPNVKLAGLEVSFINYFKNLKTYI